MEQLFESICGSVLVASSSHRVCQDSAEISSAEILTAVKLQSDHCTKKKITGETEKEQYFMWNLAQSNL